MVKILLIIFVRWYFCISQYLSPCINCKWKQRLVRWERKDKPKVIKHLGKEICEIVSHNWCRNVSLASWTSRQNVTKRAPHRCLIFIPGFQDISDDARVISTILWINWNLPLVEIVARAKQTANIWQKLIEAMFFLFRTRMRSRTIEKKTLDTFLEKKRHGLENCFLPCFFKTETKTFFKKFFVQKLEKRFGLVFTSCLLLDSNFYLFFVRLERSCIERFTAGWTNKA